MCSLDSLIVNKAI